MLRDNLCDRQRSSTLDQPRTVSFRFAIFRVADDPGRMGKNHGVSFEYKCYGAMERSLRQLINSPERFAVAHRCRSVGGILTATRRSPEKTFSQVLKNIRTRYCRLTASVGDRNEYGEYR
jgi:hypothetical protein